MTDQIREGALAVWCPKCAAWPSAKCTTLFWVRHRRPHLQRIIAAGSR